MAELSLEQAVKNHRKIARALIRLKHSVEADNELAEFMPLLEARLVSYQQEARIPALTSSEIELMLNGEGE